MRIAIYETSATRKFIKSINYNFSWSLFQQAMSFATENMDHYLFLSDVFLRASDLSSSLFCLRYAIKINSKDAVVRKRIGEVNIFQK